MKTTTSLLALALAIASPAAFAHQGDSATQMPMAQAPMQPMAGMPDMTPEQHKMMADKMWTDMDANKDGSVSRAEYDAHVARMMAMHAQMHAGMGKDEDATEQAAHASKEAAEDQAKAMHEAGEDQAKAADEAAEDQAKAAHEAAEKH